MAGWGWPNFDSFISQTWGHPQEVSGPGFIGASNIVVGTNPPYSATDFLSFYPNFGGSPILLTGVITQGSPIVTGLQTTGGILPGQPVSPCVPIGNALSAGAFPDGAVVSSIDSDTQLTLSQAATRDFNIVAIYNAPYLGFGVLNAFIALASASLIQARWCEMWPIAMALFVNHWATLYLRSASSPAVSAAQLASQGLARGIQTSKSAGGVSVSIQPSTASGGLEAWGAWTETEAGCQLITMARCVGAGPLLLY